MASTFCSISDRIRLSARYSCITGKNWASLVVHGYLIRHGLLGGDLAQMALKLRPIFTPATAAGPEMVQSLLIVYLETVFKSCSFSRINHWLPPVLPSPLIFLALFAAVARCTLLLKLSKGTFVLFC